MNMISKAMAHFGFAPPFHDIDLIHEPSARSEISGSQLRGSSPRSGRPGVDGPAASTSPDAVGHPTDDEVSAALRGAFRGDLDHLRQVLNDAEIEAKWLLSNVQAAVRLLDDIAPAPAELAQARLDRNPETKAKLAQAEADIRAGRASLVDVTDISTKRK